MAHSRFDSVDEYIASQPEGNRKTLSAVREAIRNVLPKAEEVISYGIPAYKLNGTAVVYFAGWKRHYSLYPASAAIRDKFAKELTVYEVNNKGTIRFPLSAEVPTALIGRIARVLAKEASKAAQSRRDS